MTLRRTNFKTGVNMTASQVLDTLTTNLLKQGFIKSYAIARSKALNIIAKQGIKTVARNLTMDVDNIQL